MKLLLLGGTRDAKNLAATLHAQGMTVIYSIAGLVRQPSLPCKVICGGFSRHGGLIPYIRDNHITGLINATHPFAQKMTHTAERATAQTGIPYWRLQRPNWQPSTDDQWQHFADWETLLESLHSYSSIFLTQGQLSESMLISLNQHRPPHQQFIHRTAIKPNHASHHWMTWIQSIGPFSLESELALFKKHRIDVLVSKHSGGALPAKLIAARQLQIPVKLLQRPTVTASVATYENIEDLVVAVSQARLA